ncbi:MAG: GTP 3',8-cyclase MoaA [bacterium]
MTGSMTRRQISLRISVTDRCSLRCVYCMPEEGVVKLAQADILSFEEIVRFVVAMKQVFEVSKVHLTGGEPLVRRNICELISLIAGEGVSDIALTTNGQGLAELAPDLRKAGLNRINISLDSLDQQTYSRLTRGGRVEKTLEGIQAAAHSGWHRIKINTVVLRGYNEKTLARLVRFAFENGCHIRFLELMPIGCAGHFFAPLFVAVSEMRTLLEQSVQLTPLRYENGHSSQDFSAVDTDGRRGTVGFIGSHSTPFCTGCTRMRLTSTGQLITCLATGRSFPARHYLQSAAEADIQMLQQLVVAELDSKCTRSAFTTPRPMVLVGG